MRSTTPASSAPEVRAELVKSTPRYGMRIVSVAYRVGLSGTRDLELRLLVEHAPEHGAHLLGRTFFLPLEGPVTGYPIQALLPPVVARFNNGLLVVDPVLLLGQRLSAEIIFEEMGQVLEPRLRDVRRVL